VASLEMAVGYVHNSRGLEDQYLGFVPKDEKFDIVKNVVSKKWFED
jgi:hypothetical protein